MLRAKILILALIGSIGVAAFARESDSEGCDETTADAIACYVKVAERADAQLRRDWIYLTKLARSRNEASLPFLSMGHMAFRNYLQKNCESEGHDAFGGSLQEVLEQKCRRDTILARRRLFERIGEAHPLGREAEHDLGRPICTWFQDTSKPRELGEVVRMKDVDDLRKKLDEIGNLAAQTGNYSTGIARLPRAVHNEADKLRVQDSTYTCMGILKGFCPTLDAVQSIEDIYSRDQWLSRCQTEIQGAFYKRASTRLRILKTGS